MLLDVHLPSFLDSSPPLSSLAATDGHVTQVLLYETDNRFVTLREILKEISDVLAGSDTLDFETIANSTCI